MPAALIKLWGRWLSNAVDVYLEEAALGHKQEAMAGAMATDEEAMGKEKEFAYDDEILLESQDLTREWTGRLHCERSEEGEEGGRGQR